MLSSHHYGHFGCYYVFTDLFRSFFVSQKIFKRKGRSEMATYLIKNVGYEVLWVCLYEISGVFIINKSVSGCAYGTGSFFHVFSWIFSSFDRTMRVCLCVYFHN